MGYELFYDGNKRYFACRSDGCNVFGVEKGPNNVLVVKALKTNMKQENDCAAMALDEAMSLPDPDIQSGSLLDFHLCFAHLSHDTIERMAGDRENRIRLTNKKRPICVTCAHGKQRRNTQSQ